MKHKLYISVMTLALFTLSSAPLQAQGCCGAPGRSAALQKLVKKQKKTKVVVKEVKKEEKQSKELVEKIKNIKE